MELFDLYDADRMPLHKTAVRGGGIPENSYHIVIHVCIFNSRGEMLIQRRQADKANWPDLWDLSVGGTVSAGERSSEGAERELREELGIELPLRNVRPHLTIHYDTGFDDVYVLNCDCELSSLKLQQEEVQEVKWASCAEVEALLDAAQFVPYRKEYIRLLYALRSGRGTCRKEH
ncbi:MAG: NUDIX domain-containing protein [Oscillospiraceae bacterium]|nr:NUDIX domain-containing protein [Oscillospiraceae bacterium]